MALSQISKFLEEAAGYIHPDAEAVDPADERAEVAIRFHRRIVIVAATFGLLAAIVGTTGILLESKKEGEGLKTLFVGPPVFGVIGILEGVALSCAFAPREFPAGPLGKKWMTLIGTQSVAVARIVCAVLASVPVLLLVAVAAVIALKG